MSNLSEYVKKAREKTSGLNEILERRKNMKIQELEEVEMEALIAQAKKKIQDSAPTQIQHQQATDFMSLLVLNRKPAEIKEILGTITQEEIDKLAYISASMNNDNFSNLRKVLREQPTSEAKTILEAVKTGLEAAKTQTASGPDYKAIAEIFKAGVEAAKAQNPQPQSQQSPMEVYKVVAEIVKPFQEEARQKDREAQELRMQRLEEKIVNPVEYFKHIKSAAQEFGMSPTGKSEIDLKLREMDQSERLDMQKLEWEKQKHLEDKEGQRELIGTVKEIFQGPVGKAIENLGAGAADRVRSGSPQKQNLPQVIQTTCPACGKSFFTPDNPTVVCGYCGATLAKSSVPAPAPQPQAPQPQAPQPQPEQQTVAETQPPVEQPTETQQPQ